MDLRELKQFTLETGLPRQDEEIKATLNSPRIGAIRSYVLGPAGTNISQANEKWMERMDIRHKTQTLFFDTPEDCLLRARAFTSAPNKVGLFTNACDIGIFWTCAVYYALHNIFFENPDVFPFFANEVMCLDEMQLATRKDLLSFIQGEHIPTSWVVATHPSPMPLVRGRFHDIVSANSNAHAADLCAQGIVDVCVTTESARASRDLVKLFSFGSPEMIFFAGITSRGARLIEEAYREILVSRSV